MTTELTIPPDAITRLADTSTPIEDRAALYAVLHQVQLRINRALRGPRDRFGPRDELIAYMEANGLRELGPLSVRSSGIDVAWPCNDPANWSDATMQAELDTYAKVAPDYFRHVPAHVELDTAALGAGIAASDPVAVELVRAAKRNGWRTEAGRRLSLAVREARP